MTLRNQFEVLIVSRATLLAMMLTVAALQADKGEPDRVVISRDGTPVMTWDCKNYRSALELAERIADEIADGKSFNKEGI